MCVDAKYSTYQPRTYLADQLNNVVLDPSEFSPRVFAPVGTRP